MSVTLEQILNLSGRLDDTPGFDSARERFRRFLLEHAAELTGARALIEQGQHLPGEQHHRAVQDLVVLLGKFIGFDVTFGAYTPAAGSIKHHGHWRSRLRLHVVLGGPKRSLGPAGRGRAASIRRGAGRDVEGVELAIRRSLRGDAALRQPAQDRRSRRGGQTWLSGRRHPAPGTPAACRSRERRPGQPRRRRAAPRVEPPRRIQRRAARTADRETPGRRARAKRCVRRRRDAARRRGVLLDRDGHTRLRDDSRTAPRAGRRPPPHLRRRRRRHDAPALLAVAIGSASIFPARGSSAVPACCHPQRATPASATRTGSGSFCTWKIWSCTFTRRSRSTSKRSFAFAQPPPERRVRRRVSCGSRTTASWR